LASLQFREPGGSDHRNPLGQPGEEVLMP